MLLINLNSKNQKMKIINLLFICCVILNECVDAKDFLGRITNARMAKNPPESLSDFNIIFDIELRSESKDGIFANISSIGGGHFEEAAFLYNDGRKQEKIGASFVLPLSYNETETFVYVAGDKPQMYTYKKVATICTDLKKELVGLKLLTNISGVKTFEGVIYWQLDIFSVKNSQFISYFGKVGFVANRLPTGNMMDLSMGGISITEVEIKK